MNKNHFDLTYEQILPAFEAANHVYKDNLCKEWFIHEIGRNQSHGCAFVNLDSDFSFDNKSHLFIIRKNGTFKHFSFKENFTENT